MGRPLIAPLPHQLLRLVLRHERCTAAAPRSRTRRPLRTRRSPHRGLEDVNPPRACSRYSVDRQRSASSSTNREHPTAALHAGAFLARGTEPRPTPDNANTPIVTAIDANVIVLRLWGGFKDLGFLLHALRRLRPLAARNKCAVWRWALRTFSPTSVIPYEWQDFTDLLRRLNLSCASKTPKNLIMTS